MERLNLATRAAQMGIWDWDILKNELVWDDQMYWLYGLQPGDFGGAYEAWLNGIHPDDRASSNAVTQAALSGEKEYDTEFRVLWPDGSIHWLKANGQVFRDEEGKPIRMVGVNYDITARKQTETKLSESEQKFSSLFNKSVYATTLSRLPDGVIVDVNEAFEQEFGFTRQEAIGKTSFELGFNPDAEGRARMLAEIKEHGSARNHELSLRTKSNEMRIFSVNVDLVDIDGQKYILNTTKDITEQKQAEKKIIQMKRLYATLSQVNQTIVRVKDRADLYQSICDVSTKFGEFTLAWIGILNAETGAVKPVAASGLDLEQWPFPQINIHEGIFQNGLVATAMRTSEVVTSDDIAVDERTSQSQASFANYDYHSTAIVPFQLRGTTIGILSLVSKEAELFKVGDEILLLKEMGGDISFALDVMENEAERRRVDEVLEHTRNTLAEAQKIANIGSFEFIAATQSTVWSEGEYRIYGLDPAGPSPAYDVMLQKCIHRDDAALLHETFTQALEKRSIYELEHRIVLPNGNVRWVYDRAIPYLNEQGELVRYIGITLDITERKQAEQKLRESEENYKSLFDSNPHPMWVFDLETLGFLTVNEAAIRHYGYSREEFLSMNLLDIRPAEDHQQLMETLTDVDEGLHKAGHWRHIKKDGSLIDVEITSHTLEYYGHKAEIVLANDITERKLADNALKESEARFSKVFFTNPVAQSILSTITRQTVEVNEACCRMYEYSREELIGIDPSSLDLWANPAEQLEVLEELQRTGRLLPREITIRPKSGEIRTILFSVEQIAWKGEPCLITSSVDISERKLAEQKLRESEVLLRQVLESVPDSTFALDRDYRLLIDNQRHQQALIASGGHPFVVGEQMLSPDYPAEVLEFWRAAYERALNGEIFSLESSWVDTNGQLHVHENMYSPLRDANGAIIGALVVAHDITQRKQAENSLREREQKLNAILNLLPVGVSILDQDQKVAYSNDALGKILGTTREGLSRGEYRNRKYLRANGSEKPAQEFASARAFAEKIEIHDVITGIVKEDAQIVWTSVNAVPVDFPDWKVILVTSDITERKRAEHEIQRQIQRLKGLHTIDQAISSSLGMQSTLNIVLEQTLNLLKVDAASILLFNDTQQRLDYVNGKGFRSASANQAQIHLGVGLAGQVGRSRKLLHIPDLGQIGDKFLRAEMLKDDEFVEYFGVPLIAKDTLKGVLEIFNRTPTNPDSEWLNFLEILGGQTAIAIDNARLFEGLQHSNAELEQRIKQRTSDLLRINAELKHANRTKDEFLANMSHELRTPLTSILGLAETLEYGTYGQLNEKQAKALQSIETSGRHLLDLINDILDLSKIEAGKFEIYPEVLNITDICRSSLNFVKEQAGKKSIKLEYQLAENVDSLFADPRRLKQMLINLLSNAVKFTPEKGQVKLIVQVDSTKQQIHFTVTDTGIGIAQEDLEHLFTPFTQVDSSLNRQYEGTGLGLVLVLRLAEMHGGNVQVESQVGAGSNFTISLPWQPEIISSDQTSTAQAYIQASTPSEHNSQGMLLLVDDNPTNIETIGDYLKFRGYSIAIATNGMDALIKAEENNPHLILMDIQMPVMDGLEATRRLRADPRFAKTPIIALTALAMIGDREKCIQAGANDYLSKPVHLKELVEKVENLLQ